MRVPRCPGSLTRFTSQHAGRKVTAEGLAGRWAMWLISGAADPGQEEMASRLIGGLWPLVLGGKFWAGVSDKGGWGRALREEDGRG